MLRCLGLLLAVVAGCGPPPPVAREAARDRDGEARAAATLFLQCVEREGVECRHPDAPYQAWSALRALLAVRDRSPVVLVEDLGRAFDDLRDDRRARKGFIAQLARHEPRLRAGCRAAGVHGLGGIAALGAAARARVVALGLGDTAPGARLGELSLAADALRDTRAVRLECGAATLHLVMAPGAERAWHPVELGETPVDLAGVGAGAAADDAPVALPPPAEGVDAWLPFGEDQL
ncbi:MAG TPA: hypothetical protein VGQ83_26070 [Polyangia bacterium]|jgi:hypothetical protein